MMALGMRTGTGIETPDWTKNFKISKSAWHCVISYPGGNPFELKYSKIFKFPEIAAASIPPLHHGTSDTSTKNFTESKFPAA
jgi:hypothetical protein